MNMSDNGYPEYLDALEVGDERSLRQRLEQLEQEIQNLRRSLNDARRAKRILYVSGRELRDEVTRFLAEDLRLDAAPADADDALSLSAGGEAWCHGEVRESEEGNVTKGDVARVMLRRAETGRAEDGAALLIVNTFHRGQTIVDRDQPVTPDVARRGAEDHVVVVRTLDLIRLGQRAANGFPAGEQLTEALRGGGGWFEVDASLNARLRGADDAPAAAAG
jgi:hypothetical protein